MHLVVKDGQVVAREGSLVGDGAAPRITCENTIHLALLDESAFELRLGTEDCSVIGIVPGQIITRHEIHPVRGVDGCWAFDCEHDLALIASIERHRATGRVGLGLVRGFGLRRHGALGSSVAHDSHNLIVAGTNPRDMLACVRSLAASGGGFVVAADGDVLAQLPLPIAGLLSAESANVVCRQLEGLRHAARSLGCHLDSPFGTLSFLALPVVPELRISDRGLFDVRKQELIPA